MQIKIRNIREMSLEFPGYLCEIDFGLNGNFVPFGATPDDPELHGREIFKRIEAGEFGPIAPYQEEDISTEILLRNEESSLLDYLHQTDWYVIRQQEIGERIPGDISDKRKKARNRISELREFGRVIP